MVRFWSCQSCAIEIDLSFVCHRILALPVTFRQSTSSHNSAEEDGKSGGELRLVCGPRLTYVASQSDGGTLYALVDRVVPFAATYSLHFTDGQVRDGE